MPDPCCSGQICQCNSATAGLSGLLVERGHSEFDGSVDAVVVLLQIFIDQINSMSLEAEIGGQLQFHVNCDWLLQVSVSFVCWLHFWH